MQLPGAKGLGLVWCEGCGRKGHLKQNGLRFADVFFDFKKCLKYAPEVLKILPKINMGASKGDQD